MVFYFKKILRFLLILPLILTISSGCSSSAILDEVNEDFKEDKKDINEIIQNRKIANQRERQEIFYKINNQIEDDLQNQVNNDEFKKIELDEINPKPSNQWLMPILKIKEVQKNLNYKEFEDCFNFFNNKIERKIQQVNDTITQRNANIYPKINSDWAVKFVKSDTQISVNEINLNDLNKALTHNPHSKVIAKRVDLEFKYRTRYNDELDLLSKNINIKVVVANDMVAVDNILKRLENQISSIVYSEFVKNYSDFYILDEKKSFLSPENFSISNLFNEYGNQTYSFFKKLINTSVAFKDLYNAKKIKYIDDRLKFLNINSATWYPLDVINKDKLETIFVKITNNKDADFLYKQIWEHLHKLSCQDVSCEIDRRTKKNLQKLLEANFALVPMEIAGLPLQGKVFNLKNNQVIKTTMWISKKILRNNLKIYSQAFTNFFNYYQIGWNKNEIIFKVKKPEIFQKLIIIEKKSNLKVTKMSLIFKDLLEDFWKNDLKVNKYLRDLSLKTNVYVEFNHHWTYDKNTQTIIYRAKENIGDISSYDQKSNFELVFGGSYNYFKYDELFKFKEVLKIKYQDKY